MAPLGIIFALGALVCWGFGDFFIQRSTRKVGIISSLFFIGLLAFTILTYFVKDEFIELLSTDPQKVILLSLTALIVFIAALLNFEGLKLGKMAVVEPILSAELPITIGLAIFLWGEKMDLIQIFLSALIFIGIMLAITTKPSHLKYHKRFLEKGVAFAAFGAIGMAISNFLTGVSSQSTSPLLAIWFIHSSLAIMCLIYFLMKGKTKTLFSDFKKYPTLILAESLLDNAAWIFFAFAVTIIPISTATALGEGYIALAVLLGIFVNKEKLNIHQIIGIIIATAGVIILSVIAS